MNKSDSEITASNNNWKYLSVFTFLAATIIYAVLTSYFSVNLELHDHPISQFIRLLSVSRIFLGLLFFIAVYFVLKSGLKKKIFYLALLISLIAKLILIFFSEPILEDDYNRYLWDGAVTAKGINPFLYSPQESSINQIEDEEIKSTLLELKNEAGSYFDNINHPHLRTIYPVMSQLSFAAAYLIDSFSLITWRFVLLVFDLITLGLLLLILSFLGKRIELSIIYWLNPIILHEFFNASHMDLLVLPPILIAVYFFMKNKEYFSTSFLAIAAGFKIFPIVLIPLFFRNFLPNFKKLLFHSFLFIILMLILFYPVYTSPLDKSFGLVKYSISWTNNEALYNIIKEVVYFLHNNLLSGLNCRSCITRYAIIFIFSAIVLVFSRKQIQDSSDLLKRITIVLAFMYFLSPTQFPWYFAWIIPFLVFEHKYSLLAYPILLPLYHLKVDAEFLIYVQHIPIFLWFCWELYHDVRIREMLSLKRSNIA